MSDRLGRALECVSVSFITFSLIIAPEIFVSMDTENQQLLSNCN